MGPINDLGLLLNAVLRAVKVSFDAGIKALLVIALSAAVLAGLVDF